MGNSKSTTSGGGFEQPQIVSPRGKQIKNYLLLEKLGSGAFGTVYKARKNTGDFFAAKCIPITGDGDSWKKELEAAVRVSRHDNIVSIFEVVPNLEDGNICLIMELCETGDLNKYIIKEQPNLKEKLLYLSDMAQAVQYLHQVNIIHRDLKPHNVLLASGSGRLVCKITDFGIARVQSSMTMYFTSQCGTMMYAAPEVTDMMRYTYSADIFSLGLIFYAVVSAVSIKSEKDEQHLVPLLRQDGEAFTMVALVRRNGLQKGTMIRSHFSNCVSLGELVYAMLQLNPKSRPDMATVTNNIAKIQASYKGASVGQSGLDTSEVFGHLLLLKLLHDIGLTIPDSDSDDGDGDFVTDAVNGEIRVTLGSKDSGVASRETMAAAYDF